jgi:hypothetical protein
MLFAHSRSWNAHSLSHWTAILLAGVSVTMSIGCRPASDAPATTSQGQSQTAKPQAAATAPTPPTNSTANGEAEVLSETWDAVLLDGKPTGWVRTTRSLRRDTPTPTIHNVSETTLKIRRFGNDVVEMKIFAESLQSEDGQVVSFSLRQESGGQPIVVQGRVEGGQARITTQSAGMQQESQMPWSADQGDFFAVEDSLRRTPLKPGEKRTIKLLLPGITGVQPVDAVLEAQQLESTPMLEGTQQLLKVTNSMSIMGLQMNGTCWTDAQGDLLKSYMPELKQETFRTTRERAQALQGSAGGDLGVNTVVRVASPLPHPQTTTRVVYEVTLTSRNPAECFVSDSSQTVASLDAQRARITVQAVRPDWPADLPAGTPPTANDLQPNNLIQSDNELIRTLAAGVAPEVTDPWQVAVALERWVRDNITQKNYNTGFATAADVAQSLSGDCTEHAVLLAALLRARQIPARVAVGLVYSEQDQWFAFHAWNEAWVNNRWVPLDATLGAGGIGADHLKLQTSNLAGGEAEAAMMSVLSVTHQLELTIVEAQ